MIEALADAPLSGTGLPIHLLTGEPAEQPLRLVAHESGFGQDGREMAISEIVVHP
jgi:hypothetical protein